MKLFEIISKYNLLDKVPFKGNKSFLTNELKRKIISLKIKYGQHKNKFEENLRQFTKNYITEDLQEKLKDNPDIVNQTNEQIIKYQNELLQEEINIDVVSFNQTEYDNIVDVMFDDVELNGVTIPIQQFLEIFYNTFITKE